MGNIFSCGARDLQENDENNEKIKIYTYKDEIDKEKIYDFHDFMHKSIV